MRVKKIIYTCMIASCCLLTGCNSNQSKDVTFLVCEGDKEETKLNGYEFELADDGKTINKLIFKAGYNEAFIKEAFGDVDIDEKFTELRKECESILVNFLNGNEDVTWLSGTVIPNEEKHEVSLYLQFDFTDENFNIKDEMTVDYLNTLKIYDQFYNEDEMRFEVSEKDMEKKSLTSESRYACEFKTFDKENKYQNLEEFENRQN